MLEPKLNEVFKYKNKNLKCVKGECNDCTMDLFSDDCLDFYCFKRERDDSLNVIFKEDSK